MLIFNVVNTTQIKVSKKYLRKVVEKILEEENFKDDFEASLVLVGDKKMRSLNKKYRGSDKATDVLSFDLNWDAKELKYDKTRQGEIIISLDQVKRQVKKIEGNSFRKELSLLLIHGVLHLLGYNHEGTLKEKKRRMLSRQEELLIRISH